MTKFIYVGPNSKYHDKETKEVFATGKEYDLTEERVEEIHSAVPGLFEAAEDNEEAVEEAAEEATEYNNLTKAKLIEKFNPEGVTEKNTRKEIIEAIEK